MHVFKSTIWSFRALLVITWNVNLDLFFSFSSFSALRTHKFHRAHRFTPDPYRDLYIFTNSFLLSSNKQGIQFSSIRLDNEVTLEMSALEYPYGDRFIKCTLSNKLRFPPGPFPSAPRTDSVLQFLLKSDPLINYNDVCECRMQKTYRNDKLDVFRFVLLSECRTVPSLGHKWKYHFLSAVSMWGLNPCFRTKLQEAKTKYNW